MRRAVLNNGKGGRNASPLPEFLLRLFLAVHNVKTANCSFLAQCAVQRGGDIVSHWFY